MPKRTSNTFSLVRGRIRTSYNKHNFFNFYKKSKPNFRNMTLYQQKFASKQETRAYHGEHITEGRWQTIFEPKLKGVAQLDASLKGSVQHTPMVLQTFAGLEKRLDFALFRAMFASSVRQARRLILSKHVTVNGVPIVHPGYTLKPGDMFSVTPEKVLEALGAKKPSLKEAYKVDKTQVIEWQKFVRSAKENPRDAWEKQKSKHSKFQTLYRNRYTPELNLDRETGSVNAKKLNLEKMKSAQKAVSRKSVLKDIVNTVKKAGDAEVTTKTFEKQFGDKLAPKALQVYELFAKDDKVFKLNGEEFEAEISKIVPTFKDGEAEGEVYSETKYKKMRQILSEINTQYLEKIRQDFAEKPISEDEIINDWAKKLHKHKKLPEFSEVQEKGQYHVNLPWQRGMYGLKDPSKSYFTPWRLKPFVAPLAVLPKYMEISFKTCHAVFLRDPVARPGESEVITPFDESVFERAFMYYQKRGM
ncbi:unnamed protein product [Ambrosiozyma monospora]|uniref:Small ribosomal subunit protein uS4m n=2 Tax=Ambrosiozyma monospora TaxID=43982 RepID=A0A9W7DMH2_AMBMO|nr:unnamed protein product [Ambrosiozyma monospora]